MLMNILTRWLKTFSRPSGGEQTSRWLKFSRAAASILIIALSTLIWCHLFNWLGERFFAIKIVNRVVQTDVKIQFLYGMLLWVFLKKPWAVSICQVPLIAIFFLGNAAKMSLLGGPISPDDIIDAGINLVRISFGWELFLILSPFLIFLVLIAVFYKWRPGLQICVVIGFLGLWNILLSQGKSVLKQLDAQTGYVGWDQWQNYLSLGPSLYLTQEVFRFQAGKPILPAEAEVKAALEFLNRVADPLNPTRNTLPALTSERTLAMEGSGARNVHFIVAESFWDIAQLKKAKFSRDPMHEGFRQLWERTGRSQVLSPAFGGGTANAEFEALCGLQIDSGAIIFERQTNRSLPCLPRLLAEAGYETIASHANIPAFWNRSNAYPKLGFSAFHSKNDFQLDDMNQHYLSDESFYRQVRDKVGQREHPSRPLFNYLLTMSGHGPYPLNDRRPAVVTSRSRVEQVRNYANSLY